MKKLILFLLLLPMLAMAQQQTRPTTPVQKPQNTPYLDTSTGIRWFFDGTVFWPVAPYNPTNMVMSGLSLTVVSNTLTVHTGTWRINNTIYSLGTNTNLTLQSRDSVLYHYEAVYATAANNSIGLKVGTTSLTPIQPTVGADTLIVGLVLIAPDGTSVFPPGPASDFVFAHPTVKQLDANPWTRTERTDTLKIAGQYIFPSRRGLSGQVLQDDGTGNLFWSYQATYLPGFGLDLAAQTFSVDTFKMVTNTAMMDTLLRHAAHFDSTQFSIVNDTIHCVACGIAGVSTNNGISGNGAGSPVILGGNPLIQNTEIDATGFDFDVIAGSGNSFAKLSLLNSRVIQAISRKSSTDYATINVNTSGSQNFINLFINASGGHQKAMTMDASVTGIVFDDSFNHIGLLAGSSIDTANMTITPKMYVTSEWVTHHSVSGVAWGAITGTLSSQTDLNTALGLKAPTSRNISTGLGLSGGGDLSADRTIIADTTVLKSKVGFATDYSNLSSRITTNTSNISTNTSNILLKLNISDTAAMAYVHINKNEAIAGQKTFNKTILLGSNAALNFGSTTNNALNTFTNIVNSNTSLTLATSAANSIIFTQNSAESARFNASGRLLIASTTDDGASKLQVYGVTGHYVTGVAVTPTDGVIVGNPTLSTSGTTIQDSPNLTFGGHVWNTTVTAADNFFNWRIYANSTTGTTPITSLNFDWSRTATSTPSYSNTMILSPNTLAINGTVTAATFTGTNMTLTAGALTSNRSAVTTTIVDANKLMTTTASTVGVPNQYSPANHFGAHVWNTTATAADNWADFVEYVAVTSAATPIGTLTWGASIATTSTPSYTSRMTLTNTGNLAVTGGFNANVIQAAGASWTETQFYSHGSAVGTGLWLNSAVNFFTVTPSVDGHSGNLGFNTSALGGTPTSVLKWSDGGQVTVAAGALVVKNALAAINSTATATAAQMGGGTITSTSAAPTTITFATATLLATQIGAAQGTTFPITIDNTAGASTVTIILGAGMTGLNSPTLTVPSGTSGVAKFEMYFSSATACTIARIY